MATGQRRNDAATQRRDNRESVSDGVEMGMSKRRDWLAFTGVGQVMRLDTRNRFGAREPRA
jgi:hypothetical protein